MMYGRFPFRYMPIIHGLCPLSRLGVSSKDKLLLGLLMAAQHGRRVEALAV